MPRKQKVVKTIIQEESEEELEPEGAQEPIPETPKPKKVLSEIQLANLERAREAAVLKKRQLKEEKDKANSLEQEKLKLKAMQYDQVKQQQQEFVQAPSAPQIKPTKSKKIVKKVIEVEESESDESEYEEVVVKRKVGRPRIQSVAQQQDQNQYNNLLYKSAQETIQQKIMEERAKSFMNSLMPRC